MVTLERIDVFHHQVPQRALGIERGGLQQFDNKHLRVVDALVRQFAHLINGGVAHNLVLIGHGQHLVASERLAQRDETQLRVERIFGGRQTPRALHLFELAAARVADAVQILAHTVDVAQVGGADNAGQQIVRVVGGIRHGRHWPHIGCHRFGFAQVGERDDIAVIFNGRADVRDPNLQFRDFDTAVDQRQFGQSLVVVVAEILPQEIVLVFVVFVGLELELGRLRAAFHLYRLALGTLFGKDTRHIGVAELQPRLDTEQFLHAGNQRRVQRETDVTGLYRLDDVVFLALVL